MTKQKPKKGKSNKAVTPKSHASAMSGQGSAGAPAWTMPVFDDAPELAHITPSLRQLAVPIASLTPDPRNARRHNERNLESIKYSLTKFGQQRPISIDADGIVLAGNGTLSAATALGWTHIAAARSHLRGLEARAYAIADNRTAELAEWDATELQAQLAEIADAEIGIDTDGLAFTDEELDGLLSDSAGAGGGTGGGRAGSERNFEPVSGETQPRLDQRKAVTCPSCQKEFVPGKREDA